MVACLTLQAQLLQPASISIRLFIRVLFKARKQAPPRLDIRVASLVLTKDEFTHRYIFPPSRAPLLLKQSGVPTLVEGTDSLLQTLLQEGNRTKSEGIVLAHLLSWPTTKLRLLCLRRLVAIKLYIAVIGSTIGRNITHSRKQFRK